MFACSCELHTAAVCSPYALWRDGGSMGTNVRNTEALTCTKHRKTEGIAKRGEGRARAEREQRRGQRKSSKQKKKKAKRRTHAHTRTRTLSDVRACFNSCCIQSRCPHTHTRTPTHTHSHTRAHTDTHTRAHTSTDTFTQI